MTIRKNIWPLAFFLLGLFVIYQIGLNQLENEQIQSNLRLEQIHSSVNNQFKSSLNRFAAKVAGMRSFVNFSENFPSAEAFQTFVREQMSGLNSEDSVVVSFIDTSHVFRYSFTPNAMDPAGLVGKEVKDLRSEEKIRMLNELMNSDDLKLFPPINMYEGWVGFPINFRVYREGKTIGYVAPLINFKSIVSEIYMDNIYDNYVFSFQWGEEFEFDRERVYDGTKVYHNRIDSEYHENFDIDQESFMYSSVEFFGQTIKIGSASKEEIKTFSPYILGLLLAHLLLSFMLFLLNRYAIRKRLLSEQLDDSNKVLEDLNKDMGLKNETLIRINNTKDKLISFISHDLKQPLNSINGLLSLLESEDIDSDTRKIVSQLKRDTESTTTLVNNLQSWATFQSGHIPFNPVSLNLIIPIKETLDLFKYKAKQKEIKIRTDVDESLIVNADYHMLAAVFRNLLANGLKFTNPGGRIDISARIEDSVQIRISDNGIGMTEEELERLSDLRMQVSRTGTQGELGSGLGLMIAKEFIERHNGKLDVESRINEGTTFIISLPKT